MNLVAARADITVDQATLFVAILTETIIEEVSKGKKVSVYRFGSFAPHYRRPMKYRKVKTKEIAMSATKRVPRFCPSLAFKSCVAEW